MKVEAAGRKVVGPLGAGGIDGGRGGGFRLAEKGLEYGARGLLGAAEMDSSKNAQRKTRRPKPPR